MASRGAGASPPGSGARSSPAGRESRAREPPVTFCVMSMSPQVRSATFFPSQTKWTMASPSPSATEIGREMEMLSPPNGRGMSLDPAQAECDVVHDVAEEVVDHASDEGGRPSSDHRGDHALDGEMERNQKRIQANPFRPAAGARRCDHAAVPTGATRTPRRRLQDQRPPLPFEFRNPL